MQLNADKIMYIGGIIYKIGTFFGFKMKCNHDCSASSVIGIENNLIKVRGKDRCLYNVVITTRCNCCKKKIGRTVLKRNVSQFAASNYMKEYIAKHGN